MRRDGRTTAVLALALSVAACSGSSPTAPEGQSIETVTFAEELNIDLADFTELGNGVYIKDEVVGEGEPIIYGSVPTVTFTGWLADGTVFAEGTLDFIMGVFRLPVGLEEGMLNARVGGTRWLLVPPNKGLGGIEQFHELGTMAVPPGSVLVYEVFVQAVDG